MSDRGKQINYFIKTRKEREKEGRREAQMFLFSSKEAEFQYLYERALANIAQWTPQELAEVDAEIARSRERRKKVTNSLDK